MWWHVNRALRELLQAASAATLQLPPWFCDKQLRVAVTILARLLNWLLCLPVPLSSCTHR